MTASISVVVLVSLVRKRNACLVAVVVEKEALGVRASLVLFGVDGIARDLITSI